MSDTTFTSNEAMAIRKLLRDMLGLGEEHLPPSQLCRMIVNEMERMGDKKKVAGVKVPNAVRLSVDIDPQSFF